MHGGRGRVAAPTCAKARARAITLFAVAGVVLLVPSAVAAQTTRVWFPSERIFDGPIAAPLEPRFSAALVGTSLFRDADAPRERPAFALGEPAEDARTDLQAVVGVGATIPVVQWRNGDRTVGIGFQVLATERFRMEEASRDELGGDWIAALPITWAADGNALRLRILHRSAHLGDEFMEEAGARRIEFSYEAAELLAAHRIGEIGRVYAGGTAMLRSQTYTFAATSAAAGTTYYNRVDTRDRWGVQAGLELRPPGASRGRIWPVLGVDWQRMNHSGTDQVNAAIGLEGRHLGKTARLLGLCHDGASPLGEFFLSTERFCGAQFTVEF